MKSNESHDVARNPVDLSSATEEVSAPDNLEAHENKRRRLIRGAVACAPIVLTLRSGALAAASCTGARFVVPDSNGKIEGAVSENDSCVLTYQQCDGSAIETQSADGVYPLSLDGSNYRCIADGNVIKNRPVAIVSSVSATSLISQRLGI